MDPENNRITVSDDANKVLRLVLYYDIFDHPLSEEELMEDCSISDAEKDCLESLVGENLIYRLNGYYSVRKDPQLSTRRKKGRENTTKAMPRALRMGRLISRFPFVRAVALSGSISKGYMDSYKDVDYFIITKPNRLWLARTLLVIYKKVFLLNSFRFFCLNYFIDEENLEIRDKNIFTATEINTMIPVSGHNLIDSFLRSNSWVEEYYPAYLQNKIPEKEGSSAGRLKRLMEGLLTALAGNWLDILAMKFTVWYWKKKYRNHERNLLEKSFRLSRNEAKYHPGDFQNRVLSAFRQRASEFEKNKNVKIDYGE